jgi:hypothetical protein
MIGMNDVKELLTQADDRTLTMYVNVDNARRENQADFAAWRIEVKNALDNMARGLTNEQKEAWPYIRDWVDEFVRSYEPSAKTLVIVAGSSYQNTFELPFAIDDETQVFMGRPQIGPLLWLIDEYESYLIVMADQEKARFFTTYLGSMGFQGGMESDVHEYDFAERTSTFPGANVSQGSNVHGSSAVDDFQGTLNEHRKRFYKEIIDQIGTMMQGNDTRRIILGGSEQTGHQLYNLMDERMQAKVVTIKGVPMYSTPAEILSFVQDAALEYERQEEMILVDQVVNFAKGGGRGALGVDEVRAAMDMQRVETLVMVYPFENEEISSELAFRALELNSAVELVHGEAAALLHDEAQGGIGARLYYTL